MSRSVVFLVFLVLTFMARNSEVCASSSIYVVHVYCCGELGGVGAAGITEVANVNAMEREGPKMNWTAQRKVRRRLLYQMPFT